MARAVTARPDAGVGIAPAVHPFAGAMLTVGIMDGLGAGSVGLGPTAAPSGRLEESPQAASMQVNTAAIKSLNVWGMTSPRSEGLKEAAGRSIRATRALPAFNNRS